MSDDPLIGQINAIARIAIDHLDVASMRSIEAALRNAADDVGSAAERLTHIPPLSLLSAVQAMPNNGGEA